ncbi:MAG: amino acid adenylation domain-containing protein, partial [Bacillota bacterium]|nr:amino acid adenylation domain-containing protein [Bacillota bacterium]
IMGILKAGGAYLPIDPEYPKERIEYMLEDSKADILLTQTQLVGKSEFSREVIEIDREDLYVGDSSNLKKINISSDLAYVIYTSGSTGKPKGVMIEHRGLTNYITWAAKCYKSDSKINMPMYTNISFDLTVTSTYLSLILGDSIVIYKGEKSNFLIQNVIEENKTSLIKLTPSHMQLLSQINYEGDEVKKLIVGGENLSVSLAQSIHTNFKGLVEIYNEYGPTEATVGCMIYKFRYNKDCGQSVPIGKPSDNMRIYILDKYLKLVSRNIVGEMYISGEGLARGYLNRPELTDEKFIQNPYEPGERMYKTGDLARWLPDGNIEYIGRIDHQVKIRGF